MKEQVRWRVEERVWERVEGRVEGRVMGRVWERVEGRVEERVRGRVWGPVWDLVYRKGKPQKRTGHGMQTVWILVRKDEGGSELTAHPSEAGARRELERRCRELWADVFDDEPEPDDQTELIDRYYDALPLESYDIHDVPFIENGKED